MKRRAFVMAAFGAVFSAACASRNRAAPPTRQSPASPSPAAGTPAAAATSAATVPFTATAAGSAAVAPSASVASASPTSAPLPEGRVTVPIADGEIDLPAALTIDLFAEGLGRPRFMAQADDGSLYVTDLDGRVLKLTDRDGDGVSGATTVVLDGLDRPHGITLFDGALWVAETGRVSRVDGFGGNEMAQTVTTILDDIPPGGRHSSRTIRFGPDGKLYLSIGSSCDVCIEDNDRRATITRYAPDGSGRELVARGLRNAVGMAFQPVTGELWATNNSRDGLGDDTPPETLNRVADGADFGWPRCHAGDIPDPEFGGANACAGVTPPAVRMQAHSAPLGLAFNQSDALGAAYRDGAFVAFHGSWNRSVPTGYKVVFLPFRDGQPTGEVLDFAFGWLTASGAAWGRPVDVLVAPDGSLFVTDDAGGRLYRIRRA